MNINDFCRELGKYIGMCNENTCKVFLPLEFRKVFYAKGEVYRYLHRNCIGVDTSLQRYIIQCFTYLIRDLSISIDKTVQFRINVKTYRNIGLSIVAAFDGHKKIFYIITENIYGYGDALEAVDYIAKYITSKTCLDLIKLIRVVYSLNGDNISIKFKCRFDDATLRIVLLNSILLSFFLTSIHIPRV